MSLDKNIKKRILRLRRQKKVRAKIIGSASRPRMRVFRSLRGMYIQLIDDAVGKTLCSVNSKKDIQKKDKNVGERKGRIAEAYILGNVLAEKAKQLGIESIVFDRAGNKYHGRVKAVAEGARDGGLVF